MIDSASMQGVLSRFLPHYQQQRRLSPQQGKACAHIRNCRTEALGAQRVHCDQCGFDQVRYHSCRNRHCPKCQHRSSSQWRDKQSESVLPMTYYHVVFTLPHRLNGWVQLHPEIVYRCLFDSVWRTIKGFGHDKKRLNGEMGMSAVLHTWGQNLSQHVHLHCLIPGGALSNDQQHWHQAKSNYLFPVKALSRYYRGTMVSALRHAWRAGELARLESDQVDGQLDQLMQSDWVVYSKAYIKKADTVVNYLSRYTHKIALSDHRIKMLNDRQVCFSYKDYRDDQLKDMWLDGEEFIRRFLMHVLPSGFMRIRHYGFLSNRTRCSKLAIIRGCLKLTTQRAADNESKTSRLPQVQTPCLCPQCHRGQLKVRYEIMPKPLHGR